jgi:hypothetical protein
MAGLSFLIERPILKPAINVLSLADTVFPRSSCLGGAGKHVRAL